MFSSNKRKTRKEREKGGRGRNENTSYTSVPCRLSIRINHCICLNASELCVSQKKYNRTKSIQPLFPYSITYNRTVESSFKCQQNDFIWSMPCCTSLAININIQWNWYERSDYNADQGLSKGSEQKFKLGDSLLLCEKNVHERQPARWER